MTKLESLDLFSSSISSLPSSIGRLENLKGLNPSYTIELKMLLDEIGCMINKLEWLDLFHSSISSLPSSVGKLESLRELDRYHTMELKTLPNEIGWQDQVEVTPIFLIEVFHLYPTPLEDLRI